MSGRRSFLRNVALGIASTLLPKILRPTTFETELEEEQAAVTTPSKIISVAVYGYYNYSDINKTFYDRKSEGEE